MRILRSLVVCISMLCLLCAPAVAQQTQAAQAKSEPAQVLASASAERVRFAAPNRVARLKLEVLSASGDVVAELSTRGSILDWPLVDSQGSRLADGTYLCVLTVKDAAGRLAQRLTLLEVAGVVVTARPAASSDLTARQFDAVGPVEAAPAEVVAAGAEPAAATLVAHDGEVGRIVTTSGDLSFRGGNFFTGHDRELMRLTQDGTLEVSGPLVARGGIRFADGSVLDTARNFSRGGKGAKSGAVAGAAGAGMTLSATANRLAKFDGGGNLIDSAVTESAGRVGIGTASPAQPLHVVGRSLFQNTAAASLFVLDRTDGKIMSAGAGGSSATLAYDSSGIFKIESNSRSQIALGVFGTAQGATTRLAIDSAGNVGVGTETPQAKLHVEGGVVVNGNVAVSGSVTGAVPVGTIVAYAGLAGSIPQGWRLCNGDALNKADYPALFNAIGVSWGSPDSGVTTFNLPDLRGLFLRGVDGGAGKDPDANNRTAAKPGGNTGNAVGTVQGDILQNHTHSYTFFAYEQNSNPPHIPAGDPASYDPVNSVTGGITDSNLRGTETRPKNAAVYWIIRVQ